MKTKKTEPELSEYDIQAQAFVDKTELHITIKLLGHYKHFDDEEFTRDVYEVIFSRKDKKPYIFTFGQSTANSAITQGNVKQWNLKSLPNDNNKSEYTRLHQFDYAIKEHLKQRQWQGRTIPSIYDVLSVFTKIRHRHV